MPRDCEYDIFSLPYFRRRYVFQVLNYAKNFLSLASCQAIERIRPNNQTSFQLPSSEFRALHLVGHQHLGMEQQRHTAHPKSVPTYSQRYGRELGRCSCSLVRPHTVHLISTLIFNNFVAQLVACV